LAGSGPGPVRPLGKLGMPSRDADFLGPPILHDKKIEKNDFRKFTNETMKWLKFYRWKYNIACVIKYVLFIKVGFTL